MWKCKKIVQQTSITPINNVNNVKAYILVSLRYCNKIKFKVNIIYVLENKFIRKIKLLKLCYMEYNINM